MSSHFSTSTTRRSSPSYCKKGKWEDIDSFRYDRPIGVNVYLKWYDAIGTDFIDFTESLHAVRNATNDGYVAWSSATHPRIGVEIDDLPDLDRYDVTIHVDLYGWIMYSHTFEDVDVTPRPPWGTLLLSHTWIHHERFIETRLLA